MDYQVHPSAIVDDGAEIGAGSRVWHFVHVCGGARVGKNVSMGQNVFIGNKVTIGDNCKIQNNVSVYDNVHLEEGVFCGPSMVFTNVYNPRSLIERKDEYRDTLVKKGATLGGELHHRLRRNHRRLFFCGCRRRDQQGCARLCPGGRRARQADWLDERIR